MDTVISVIVLIVAICSIISAFAKKKPEREQTRTGGASRPLFTEQKPVQNGQAGAQPKRAGEGMSYSGEGQSRPQKQANMAFGSGSGEGASDYPAKKPVMPEEEAEPFIALEELLEHDGLVKGIIISEVLSKPKSMR